MTDESATPPKPVPHPTPISEPYWRSLVDGKLSIQRCPACDSLQHYPRPFCVNCLSSELEWKHVSGRATLFSFTVVRRAATAAFAADLPYVLAIVELEEGPHLTGNVIDVPVDDVAVGMPLELAVVPVGDGQVLPQWRPRA
jgi:uncharacterized OB-fold protein